MKLSAEVLDIDAHKEFLRFFKNTGQATWEKKCKIPDHYNFSVHLAPTVTEII